MSKVALQMNTWDERQGQPHTWVGFARHCGGFHVRRKSDHFVVVEEDQAVELILTYGPTKTHAYDAFFKASLDQVNPCNEIYLSSNV